MRRRVRWILTGLAVIAAVLTVVVWIAVDRLVSLPGFKSKIEWVVSDFLRRPLTVEELDWRRGPPVVLIGKNVRVWESPAKQELVAASPRVEVRFPLRSLFRTEPLSSERFDLRMGSVSYHGSVFKKIRVVVRRDGNAYTLDQTRFEGLGGTIVVAGSYAPARSPAPLKFTWKTQGVQARDLFRVAGSSVEVGGTADSEGNIATGVGPLFLTAMNGEIRLDLKDGWLARMPGLLKIISRLNLATLVTEIRGAHKSRIPFDETHGQVTIKNGVASTSEPFVLQNATLEIAFMGSYDLPKRLVDGKVAVNFLTVTDEIIRRVPFVRDILLGKDKGLIPIWLRVKGPADDPTVKILSAQSITSPVWNTAKRILHLPVALLEKLGGK